MQQNPARIRRELLRIHASLQGCAEEEVLRLSPASLAEPMGRLQRLASGEVDEAVVTELLRDPELRPVLDHLARIKRAYGLSMEIRAARSLIASGHPWRHLAGFPYYPNYLELARTEILGADLRAGDHVVFLGSGPLPVSLILWAKQYGLRATGIERVAEYAALSAQLVKKLELSGSIRIRTGDHFLLPLDEPCGLILIGADAQPKEEIFAHLARSLPPGAKVSYRIYEKGLRGMFEGPSAFGIPAEFNEYRRVRPRPPVQNTSVFLVKKQ